MQIKVYNLNDEWLGWFLNITAEFMVEVWYANHIDGTICSIKSELVRVKSE